MSRSVTAQSPVNINITSTYSYDEGDMYATMAAGFLALGYEERDGFFIRPHDSLRAIKSLTPSVHGTQMAQEVVDNALAEAAETPWITKIQLFLPLLVDGNHWVLQEVIAARQANGTFATKSLIFDPADPAVAEAVFQTQKQSGLHDCGPICVHYAVMRANGDGSVGSVLKDIGGEEPFEEGVVDLRFKQAKNLDLYPIKTPQAVLNAGGNLLPTGYDLLSNQSFGLLPGNIFADGESPYVNPCGHVNAYEVANEEDGVARISFAAPNANVGPRGYDPAEFEIYAMIPGKVADVRVDRITGMFALTIEGDDGTRVEYAGLSRNPGFNRSSFAYNKLPQVGDRFEAGDVVGMVKQEKDGFILRGRRAEFVLRVTDAEGNYKDVKEELTRLGYRDEDVDARIRDVTKLYESLREAIPHLGNGEWSKIGYQPDQPVSLPRPTRETLADALLLPLIAASGSMAEHARQGIGAPKLPSTADAWHGQTLSKTDVSGVSAAATPAASGGVLSGLGEIATSLARGVNRVVDAAFSPFTLPGASAQEVKVGNAQQVRPHKPGSLEDSFRSAAPAVGSAAPASAKPIIPPSPPSFPGKRKAAYDGRPEEKTTQSSSSTNSPTTSSGNNPSPGSSSTPSGNNPSPGSSSSSGSPSSTDSSSSSDRPSMELSPERVMLCLDPDGKVVAMDVYGNTVSQTSSSTHTKTSSWTPSKTSAPSISSSGTETPSETPSSTDSKTTSRTFSSTRSRSGSRTHTASRTPSGTPSPSESSSGTETPSETPSSTDSRTTSRTGTLSKTLSKSGSSSRTPSTSQTPSTTGSSSQTPSTTGSPSQTPSATGSSSQTPSATGSPSQTPSTSRAGARRLQEEGFVPSLKTLEEAKVVDVDRVDEVVELLSQAIQEAKNKSIEDPTTSSSLETMMEKAQECIKNTPLFSNEHVKDMLKQMQDATQNISNRDAFMALRSDSFVRQVCEAKTLDDLSAAFGIAMNHLFGDHTARVMQALSDSLSATPTPSATTTRTDTPSSTTYPLCESLLSLPASTAADDDNEMSTGAKVGIGVGVVVGLFLIGLVASINNKRNRDQARVAGNDLMV